MMTKQFEIACFISPHGFGHAARMCSLINSLHSLLPAASFHIITQTPEWFFEESLNCAFMYYPVETDIGLVQTSPIEVNHTRSIEKLNSYYPLSKELVSQTSALLKEIRSSVCLCDISPLGIQAARQAEIPAILIENFTWDWIYSQLSLSIPEYGPISEFVKGLFNPAFHVQLQPECPSSLKSDISIGPIARKLMQDRTAIRKALRIPVDKPMVYITLGGVEHIELLPVQKFNGGFHTVAYSNGKKAIFEKELTILPRQSGICSHDLLASSDLVIGKPGYSTVAEVVTNGIPFLYIPRPDFPETPFLEEYLYRHVPLDKLPYADYLSGRWINHVPDLLGKKSQKPVLNQVDNLVKIVLEKIFTN